MGQLVAEDPKWTSKEAAPACGQQVLTPKDKVVVLTCVINVGNRSK